ncbi:MAG: hypothetical protein ACI4AO_09720, partial [Anaerotignum sp.]
MKKFISMVMAAAMVVSLVPATAFAATGEQVDNTVKVINAAKFNKGEVLNTKNDKPELQIKVKDTDFELTKSGEYKVEFTLTLDNAEFNTPVADTWVSIDKPATGTDIDVTLEDEEDKDEIKVVITSPATTNGPFADDAKISVDLSAAMTKKSVGAKATVEFDSDDFTVPETNEFVFATVVEKGIKASIKKTVDVAEDEVTKLYSKGLKIEPVVGDTLGDVYNDGDVLKLKLSKGFEFVKGNVTFEYEGDNLADWTGMGDFDDNVVEFGLAAGRDLDAKSITIKDLKIEATSAKAGDVATITVSVNGLDPVKVEVAKVVDYKVSLTVDEDEDVPVIYSGVNVENDYITDDSDHVSLEVTAEETFPGAWSMRKGFNFELPEGVYVTAVDVTETEGLTIDETTAVDEEIAEAKFYDAYQEGNHVNFEFEKRVFDDVDVTLNTKCAKIAFTLTLVADPTFEGDVVLKLTGDLVDEQEVTIAKFVKPYTVKAEQNDLKIDYRYTEIPTAIVITEAEAGLWEKGAEFTFTVEKGNMIQFEDDATFVVDEDSELEIDDFTNEEDGEIGFVVDDESDEAATVTIKDMSLFMQRNIPAGPYDLTISSNLEEAFLAQTLFAPDCDNVKCDGTCKDKDNDCIVDDVDDYSDVVKEAWVNVITAGREVDDASFTTKVVVPVGESYIISGENQIALDVPAYINAAGYTMLPVR